jgi:hypothetical protein
MPLSPSPLLPGVSPLPAPGAQPPSAGARRLAVAISLPLLVGLLVIGQVFQPQILFLAPGLQQQAQVSGQGQADASFQGFQYPWDAVQQKIGTGGYSTPMSLQNMKSQAHDFHMNAVIIPIYADMPDPNDGYIAWRPTDKSDVHTLPDDDYIKAIKDAKSAGLLPILELEVLQESSATTSESPAFIGASWSGVRSEGELAVTTGTKSIGALEKQWFDNYSAFATHWAQISESNNLPYFIIGDGLTNVSYDTNSTSYKVDPKGRDRTTAGEPPCVNGRRDCSWRHVIHALRQAGYLTLTNHQSETGASYTGKLIYAASWGPGPSGGGATTPEFSSITWWDAVDLIGVDADFPLISPQSSPTIESLEGSWHGQGQDLGGQGDIYGALNKLATTTDRPVVFTSVEYDSITGASSGVVVSAQQDDLEQLVDMQALLLTFTGTSWWSGVFWYADQPLYPRSKQPYWSVFGNWAGDDLAHAKQAGTWLSTYYKQTPIK